jgi:hypothetical protein
LSHKFQISFCTDPEIVRNPPPQFRHMRSVYCPVGIQVGDWEVPGPGWCDFAGVLLLEWCRGVWQLSSGESRYARLVFFDTPTQIWIRPTPTQW